MISRSSLKAIARLALAAMLFTQAALAAAACEAGQAVLAIAHSEDRAAGGCHEPEDSPNLCLTHCLGGDQSLDKPLVKIPALVAAPLCSRAPVFQRHDATCAPGRMAVPRAAGPPPRLLFQSLLI